MTYVSVEGINSSNNELKGIITSLSSDVAEIENDISKIQQAVSELLSYQGQEASLPLSEPRENPLDNQAYGPRRFQYIWNINIPSSLTSISSGTSSMLLDTKEKIEFLNYCSKNLDTLSERVEQLIQQIELQLGVSYTGNIKSFFHSLKGNSGWEEMKKIINESVSKRNNDELYLKFHSQNKKKDIVDFALDELGNRYLVGGVPYLSTKYALWYQNKYGMGATPSDNWCAEFVSYAVENSGNKGAVPPYLSVADGMREVKEMANNNQGEWHDASDMTYQPKRGDIFYVDNGKSSHTGIVLGSENDHIYTIEGNTVSDDGNYYAGSSENSSFGGYVNTRTRDRSYLSGGGFYSPNYATNKVPQTTVSEVTLAMKDDIQNKFNQGGNQQKVDMG